MNFLIPRWAQRSSDSARRRSSTSDPIPAELLSMEDLFRTSPFDHTYERDQPAPTAREARRARRALQGRPRMVNPDSGLSTSGTSFRMSVLGVHSGRLFSTFTGRHSSAHAASDALSYESMLALDENNPKRGVKQNVLDKLQSGLAVRGEVDKDCHICMERFRRTTKLMHLPCSHHFCDACIRQWLYNHRTCPMCRFQFSDKDTHFV